MKSQSFGNLRQRLSMSAIALCLLAFVLFLTTIPMLQPVFVAMVALVICLALREYFQMAEKLGAKPAVNAALIFSTLLCFAIYLDYLWAYEGTMTRGGLVAGLLLLASAFLFRKDRDLFAMASTFFGVAWIALSLSCLIHIMFCFGPTQTNTGSLWFLYLIFVTKLSDTGAYFVGKQFGRIKLAPLVSPKKTVEGAIGGLLVAAGGSVLYGLAASQLSFQLETGSALGLGLILGIAGQIGDLVESLVKRDAGIKDSSALPGLGGALDVVDSLLFASPVLTMFLLIR